MIPSLKKRFWEQASVVCEGSAFCVALDGRILKTPAKVDLALPNAELAQAVADEWQAQEDKVDPATMPMTRRANVAIDKVAVQLRDVTAMLAAYGGSDLLCYRTEYPQELADRQAAAWDPLLDWAAAQLNARLRVTTGIIHVSQDADVLGRLSDLVANFEHFALTGFHDLVTNSGSLIIGLAAVSEKFDIAELWQAASVDENWQIERWGKDDEAELAQANKKQDFFDAYRFFQLVN